VLKTHHHIGMQKIYHIFSRFLTGIKKRFTPIRSFIEVPLEESIGNGETLQIERGR
jgi:hypothetical protein